MPNSMSAYEFVADGSEFRIERVARPIPVPAAGRVLVRVRASSLNYRDLIHLRNKAGRSVAGRIPLSDGAGEVVAVGSEVTRVSVGDRVAGCFFQTWLGGRFEMSHHQAALGGTADGMLTEYADLSAEGVVLIPSHLSFEEAACLPCAAVTAWVALTTRGACGDLGRDRQGAVLSRDLTALPDGRGSKDTLARGGMQAGDRVLTLGTGGVSTFAMQFATALGGSVIATSSSDEKLARAREIGATEVINYRTTPDWDKAVGQITAKRGVEHVVEVGGPGTFEKSMNCVAAGGHIALIGVLTGFGAFSGSLFPLVARNATVSGIYVGSRSDFEAMNRFVEERQLRPIIDRAFSWADAAQAFAYLESGAHFGKVVIRHDAS